jgi:uncharacterized membrane protein
MTPAPPLEAAIGRLLTLAIYVSVAVLAVGVLAMVVTGRSPLSPSPPLDLARLPSDLAGLRPEGLVWLGLLAIVATPAARVLAALVGFVLRGERRMAAVAALVLVIVVLGVVLARAPEA